MGTAAPGERLTWEGRVTLGPVLGAPSTLAENQLHPSCMSPQCISDKVYLYCFNERWLLSVQCWKFSNRLLTILKTCLRAANWLFALPRHPHLISTGLYPPCKNFILPSRTRTLQIGPTLADWYATARGYQKLPRIPLPKSVLLSLFIRLKKSYFKTTYSEHIFYLSS